MTSTKRSNKKYIRYLKPKSRPKYPVSAERDYYRVLRAVVRSIRQATENNLYLVQRALRNDDGVTDTFVNSIIQDIKAGKVDAEALEEIKIVMSEASQTVKANIIKAFAETCGVNVFLMDTQLLTNIENEWYAQQSRLVNSIITVYIEKLQTIVSNAVLRGSPMPEVEGEIRDLYGITDNRAKFIARNEISNFNGILTKQRQVDCGINAYEWSTSGDERVRPTHAENDGKYFWWNSNKLGEINGVKVYPSPKFHPGMDYNCRCVAIAVIDVESWNVGNAIPDGEIQQKAAREITPADTT